jgi:NAD(P)-dependent dehydrogenase (short-subunit alcohol dehydrogenase family)
MAAKRPRLIVVTGATRGLGRALVDRFAELINASAHIWEVPAEEMRQVVEVNILGMLNVIRHVLPAMIRRDSGVIVNLSSYWGRSTSPGVGPYCASKWAIEGMTRALAQELPKNLAAVPLNPGIIDTDMLRTCFGASAGRYIGPDEWSRAAAPFLLQLGRSDNGKPLTVPGQ